MTIERKIACDSCQRDLSKAFSDEVIIAIIHAAPDHWQLHFCSWQCFKKLVDRKALS